ncbi:MAG: LacI family DNA-binding transcriptional regulator [Gulosibacter sp.]|uniref:LacI family DNA-binding transcriptional regulator n=1 Tax=Gulosibacter sp. TaxID=2817531 RepID=UPI003F9119B9
MAFDEDASARAASRRSVVTLQDVADLAGVSRSAASFALTNRGRVAEATRERVRQAAAELGYRPNRAARNLRTQRSGIIGLCLPPNASKRGYYMDVTFGAVDAARESGTLVAVMAGEHAANSMAEVDGLVVFDPQQDDPMLRDAGEAKIPVVTGERPPAPADAVRGIVHGDHANTFQQLLDHLTVQGAQNPALIAPVGSTDWASSARAAYVNWCQSRGIKPRIRDTSFPGSAAEVRGVADELVRDRAIDAIISMTDGTVLEVLAAASAVGRTPGRDLLLASAADSPLLSFTEPEITSLDLHPREFGAACLRLMLRVLDEVPDNPLVEVSPVDLVIRASTATPLEERVTE